MELVCHTRTTLVNVVKLGRKANIKRRLTTDGLPWRTIGDHLCYLTNFHPGAHETLFGSASFFRHLRIRFIGTVWWKRSGTF